uniref:Uncharacterized protein n=1 Tax=Anguilla anguilla TaxID=7936 RepID=A0A0E9WC33_ANGAN
MSYSTSTDMSRKKKMYNLMFLNNVNAFSHFKSSLCLRQDRSVSS